MIILFVFYVDSISINAATAAEITWFCRGKIWGWVLEKKILARRTPGKLLLSSVSEHHNSLITLQRSAYQLIMHRFENTLESG